MPKRLGTRALGSIIPVDKNKPYSERLFVGVGVNRSFTQVLGSTNYSDVFLHKKTKLK